MAAAVTQQRDTVVPPNSRDVEEFAGRLLEMMSGGLATYLIDIAHRTGLFDVLAASPGTSADVAFRAGLDERYVREWLGGVTSAGIVSYEPISGVYTLPPAHAACLTGDTADNLAGLSLINALLARTLPAVVTCFRAGGGVPYSAFRPDFSEVIDASSRSVFDGVLVDAWLPLMDDVADRFARGTRVADIGCGTGHAVCLLAQAYPRSEFVGYDLVPESVQAGRQEAAELGLQNAHFVEHDVTTLPVEQPYGVVLAFDAIHDQRDPASVLSAVHDALEPGGRFVMVDIDASSRLEENLDNPMATWIYAVSTLHCMTVSLAEGGAGLGTAWGRQTAMAMLAEAGFGDVTVQDVPGDPLNCLYLARRPS